MSNITFDSEGKAKARKENIEWLRIWCEDVNDENLPHVALIGDSITEGYYGLVKESLKGIARVDYLATSYSVDSEIYNAVVRKFAEDSSYAAVHFNFGLHAYGVSDDCMEKRCHALLRDISARTNTVVGLITTVLNPDLVTEKEEWREKVIARNERLVAVAKELDLPVNDLNALCKSFGADCRNPDGVHFNEKGYALLAEAVAESLKKLLK